MEDITQTYECLCKYGSTECSLQCKGSINSTTYQKGFSLYSDIARCPPLLLLGRHKHTHTHTRTQIHTYTRTHAHTHTHTHTHTRTSTRTRIHMHTHKSDLIVIGVHEMHGRMHPNYCQIASHAPQLLSDINCSWPLFIIGLLYDDPHPSHSGKLPIKTLVARQLPTTSTIEVHQQILQTGRLSWTDWLDQQH